MPDVLLSISSDTDIDVSKSVLDTVSPSLTAWTIATANIGCLAHLQQPTATPVRHWIELVDEALA